MHKLIQISEDDLLRLIKQAVREELQSQSAESKPGDNPAGTRQEVAAYLKISISKLDQMAKTGELKSFNLGGRNVRYKWVDIEDYLNKK